VECVATGMERIANPQQTTGSSTLLPRGFSRGTRFDSRQGIKTF
jgi:hypothetical protein